MIKQKTYIKTHSMIALIGLALISLLSARVNAEELRLSNLKIDYHGGVYAFSIKVKRKKNGDYHVQDESFPPLPTALTAKVENRAKKAKIKFAGVRFVYSGFSFKTRKDDYDMVVNGSEEGRLRIRKEIDIPSYYLNAKDTNRLRQAAIETCKAYAEESNGERFQRIFPVQMIWAVYADGSRFLEGGFPYLEGTKWVKKDIYFAANCPAVKFTKTSKTTRTSSFDPQKHLPRPEAPFKIKSAEISFVKFPPPSENTKCPRKVLIQSTFITNQRGKVDFILHRSHKPGKPLALTANAKKVAGKWRATHERVITVRNSIDRSFMAETTNQGTKVRATNWKKLNVRCNGGHSTADELQSTTTDRE